MALSRDAQNVMDQLVQQYVDQGYPPHREWAFQMPVPLAQELKGEGLIEDVTIQDYVLTEPGHEYVMQRAGK